MTACNPRLRASIYVRNSKAIGLTNVSQEGMIKDCRRLCDAEGLEVVGMHVDNGTSGAVRDRPHFVEWLDDARYGRADVLVSWAGDRLTREGANAAGMILDVIEGKDPRTGAQVRLPVRFMSVDDRLDSTGDSEGFRWAFVIRAEVARAERERMKARNKATAQRLAAQGRIRGAAPFGTRANAAKMLEADPAEADLLRRVAGRLITGESFRTLVHWLNASGYRTRRGGEWTRSSLRETLRSTSTRTHVLDRATRRELDKIIPPHNGVRRRRASANKGGRPPRLLTRGIARCGSCGRTMTTSAGRYICASTGEGGECPRIVSITADAADAFIAEEFVRRFGHLEFMERREVVLGAEDVEAARDAVEIAEAVLLADLTPENMERVVAARDALATLDARPVERRVEWVRTGETFAEAWSTGDSLTRRGLLSEVVDGPITIQPTVDGFPGYEYGRRGSVVETSKRVRVPWNLDRMADLATYGSGA